MEFPELLLNFVIFLIFFCVGYYYGNLKGKMHVIETHDYYPSYSEDPNAIEFYIEQHGEDLFLYEKLTDTFIMKYTTLEEVQEGLRNRYPGKIIFAKRENLEKFGFM